MKYKLYMLIALGLSSNLSAKVYTAVNIQSGLFKKGIYLNGVDEDNHLNKISSNTRKKGNSEHAFSVGASFGYIHEMKYVNPFLEFDYLFCSKQYKTESLDYTAGPDNALPDERISIKAGHSFGLTLGLEKKVSDKVAILSGVRTSLDKYEVHAFHNGHRTGLYVDNGNFHKKEKYILRMEPHLGAKYYYSDNVFAKFSLGYAFSRKTKFFNYLQNEEFVRDGISSNVAIKPQGVVFRLSVGMNLN